VRSAFSMLFLTRYDAMNFIKPLKDYRKNTVRALRTPVTVSGRTSVLKHALGINNFRIITLLPLLYIIKKAKAVP
jgi:hypothetical protein